MSDSPGRRAARDLVMSIADDRGHLTDDDYARMDAHTRRRVGRAILNMGNLVGASAVLLAKDLYSKDVRFIFELLQNADDNCYSESRKLDQIPTVAFQLYKDKFVVECNEDGFEEVNLRAICAIGQSSKTQEHGYIGEKGIGFKSVFKVAWKALIQSGDYSFAFKHRPGESGMGMITPEWDDNTEGTPDEGWTRITLYLHEDSQAPARYQDILKQLNELDSTTLLFLKKLRRIDITIHNDGDDNMESTTLLIDTNDITHRAVLTKKRSMAGAVRKTSKKYCHVTKYQTTDLPDRTYRANKESEKSYSNAEVILAFPITSDDVPIIEAQQVFAFLPIRQLGFKFLIQTDFVTMASREDVLTSAPRNISLLDEIAKAFVVAIHEMYIHEKLRYQWMRYLTGIKDYPWDDFWKTLVDKILAGLQKAEIIEPRRRGTPRRIRDLRCLEDLHQDSDGKPLFRDLPGPSELYISTRYSIADQVTLEKLGLPRMHFSEFLARVKYDLSLQNSRLKNQETTEDWHERAAKAINQVWDINQRSGNTYCVEDLSLLPLSDGTWVSAKAGDVYFPTLSSGIMLPTGLGVNVLATSACDNTERFQLFKNLGAQHASVKYMRNKTKEILRSGGIRQISEERAEKEKLVYIPAVGDDEAAWAKPSDCLMDAPHTLRHKYPIVARYEKAFPEVNLTDIVQSFQNCLGIARYTWKSTIDELKHLQEEQCFDFDGITAYYQQDFENSCLIFMPTGKNNWLSPSECLWSSATEIQDRTSLSQHYDNTLEDFFVDVLNVPRLDINMVYDELLRVDPNNTTIKQVKDLLWQMNALLIEGETPEGSAEELLEKPILPIQYSSGEVKLCSDKNDFAIVDRLPLMRLFRGKAKLLDFDLHEVHKLHPFIEWAMLDEWYLSKVVREATVVDDKSAFPLSDGSREISRKAQALTRVAVHLRSPRVRDVQAFYDLLCSAKTLETNTISSQLTVSQDGTAISVEKQQNEVYIDDNAKPLTIYVPHDEVSLYVCFGSSLPRHLVTWMVTNPITNSPEREIDESIVAVVVGILSTNSIPAIDRILENNGIVDVTILDLGP
ncbi:hypothetical protein PspLS_01685 [Pyricularia sp. CBS 133598]|nr:hypothetical protein PspLS_01685 [Pyricularia sp. CBS 133598]